MQEENKQSEKPIDLDNGSVPVEQSFFPYFAKTNFINKQIIVKQKLLLKHLSERWSDLPQKQRDGLLDLLFVEDDIRSTYNSLSLTSNDIVDESFPRLHINSGQKINVDFENDLWTWRDEHSGPFSWMSRSQQDLTLIDLEPENITKPQPKSVRTDTEAERDPAVRQFENPGDIWSRGILNEFQKVENSLVLTPASSTNFKSDETEDKPEEQIEETVISEQPKSEAGSRRSPSLKKSRSGSIRKSPSKTIKEDKEKIVEKDLDEELHAFSNPVMETEWSKYVGDESKVNEAPDVMVIDRGSDLPSPGNDDKACLVINNSPLPDVSRVASAATSDWSAESTPDHTTHLLKGNKVALDKSYISPVHHNHEPQEPDGWSSQEEVYHEEKDEVLTVETDGCNYIVSTDAEGVSLSSSAIKKTGFDFLDNW